MAGIYLHIPFCQRRCNYCDFISTTGQEKYFSAYEDSINQEIDLYGDLFPDTIIDTIYFGGGTPSIFPAEGIANILAKLRSRFNISPKVEITLEANPGTITEEKLAIWFKAGVNRLSFGLQATQANLLTKLGRIHDLAECEMALKWAKARGFKNISVDLMYGLPEQGIEDLKASIDWVVAQGVQHISIYGLQVEENTVFHHWQEQGKLLLPSEELVEEMYDYLTVQLPNYGFKRYEISNFAQHGYESRHNYAYWQDVDYLGLGAGAHSYLQGQRWYNLEDLQEYMAVCTKGVKPVDEVENIDETIHMEEFAFLALRTTKGINKNKFKSVFGKELEEVYGEVVQKLIVEGLLKEDEDFVALTKEGMKFGNRVFVAFLL